jgi:hypothetical protein
LPEREDAGAETEYGFGEEAGGIVHGDTIDDSPQEHRSKREHVDIAPVDAFPAKS